MHSFPAGLVHRWRVEREQREGCGKVWETAGWRVEWGSVATSEDGDVMEGKGRILISGLMSLESILWSVRSSERFWNNAVELVMGGGGSCYHKGREKKRMKTSLGRKKKESWQKAEEKLGRSCDQVPAVGTAGLLWVESGGARGQSTGRRVQGQADPGFGSWFFSTAIRGGALGIEPGEISSWSGLKDLSAQVKLKQDRRNIPGGEGGLGLGQERGWAWDKSKQWFANKDFLT